MPKILFKVLTLGLLVSSSSIALERSNPVFIQLKNDMWNMGVEFDYVHGDKIVTPKLNTDSKQSEPQLRSLQIEEISRALSL